MTQRNNLLTKIINSDFREKDSNTHTYIDLNMINNDYTSNQRKQVQFKNQKSGTIISNSEDYYVYVCRMHIDTINSLPVWIPQIDLTSNDINKTVYSFSMTYKTYVYQEFCEFVPQKPYEQIPNNSNGQDVTKTEYYFVYSYSYIVNLMNTTLTNCFTGLKELAIADGDTSINNAVSPFLIYDPSSGEIILQSPLNFYDCKVLENPIKLYMNSQMFNMFSSFEYIDFGLNNISNGINFQILIYNNNNLNVLQLQDDTSVIQSYQEYPCISNWSPVESIVLVANNMSINPNIYTQPYQFNSQYQINENTSENETLNVITDFQLPNSTEYLPSIQYTPSQFRLIDMVGHIAYNTINISAFWRDSFNNMHFIYLPVNGRCSLKLCFRLKSAGL